MNKEQWEQDVERFVREYEDISTFDNILGRELCGYDFEEQRISYRFETKPWQKNERGEIHGGILGGMFDSAIGTVAIYASGWKETTTVELSVSYLRPLDGDSHAVVHSYIVKNGRNLIRLRGEMVCEETGKLVATAYGTWFPLCDRG